MQECDYYGDSVSTLGERIGVARDRAGLSEGELADRMAVQERTVHAWEGDAAEPRANMLNMLAGVLGVTPAWLISGVGDGVSSPDEMDRPVDGNALRQRLLGELREAVATQAHLQRRIARLADAIAAIE